MRAQATPTGADRRICTPFRDVGFITLLKKGKRKTSKNPAIPDSSSNLVVDRIRCLRKFNSALPAIPATKPKDPQETAVIGQSQNADRMMSRIPGAVVSLMGFWALRVAINKAENTVVRNAANAPAFNTKATGERFSVRASSMDKSHSTARAVPVIFRVRPEHAYISYDPGCSAPGFLFEFGLRLLVLEQHPDPDDL